MTVAWNPGPTTVKIVEAARAAVVDATEGVLATGNGLIAEPPKTGRIYRRRGAAHQASAPGQSPATDTGALIQSGSTMYPAGSDPMVVRGVANWSAAHALMLEAGTMKMAPRPYARPALDLIAPTLPQGLAIRIGQALR